MDRTVPQTGSEEIELYIRTYYSLLRSTTDVRIRSLEEVHANMGSSLHLAARSPHPDMGTLVYTSLRLPACIADVDRVVLGQSQSAFLAKGIGDVETWLPVTAKARRRRSFFDGQHTLACYIGSRSDIDDMVPILTGFQIEWNKLHRLLQGDQVRRFLQDPLDTEEGLAVLATGLGVESEELERLREVWGDSFWPMLRAIAGQRKDFRIRLLAGSLRDYRQATHIWWERVEQAVPSIQQRPVYFISSNAHSLVNLISGFALRHEEELIRYLERPECSGLLSEWEDIQARQVRSSRENFLYYVLKKYVRTEGGKQARQARAEDEKAWNLEYTSFIEDRADLEKFPWEIAARLDLSKLQEVEGMLPEGMKVIAVSGKIFTLTWMLMGFNHFAMSLIMDEQLVADPDPVLARLCDFLGIQEHESLKVPTRAGIPWKGNSMFALQFDGISTASVGRWKTQLSNEDVQVIERIGSLRTPSRFSRITRSPASIPNACATWGWIHTSFSGICSESHRLLGVREKEWTADRP